MSAALTAASSELVLTVITAPPQSPPGMFVCIFILITENGFKSGKATFVMFFMFMIPDVFFFFSRRRTITSHDYLH
jgi:hypothetical protein